MHLGICGECALASLEGGGLKQRRGEDRQGARAGTARYGCLVAPEVRTIRTGTGL